MQARSSASNRKRSAPSGEEVPDGAAFNLGDMEAEYGKSDTKFKAPRYRKPKAVTDAAKNIGNVQYQRMYDKAAWFTGVIPFLASPKKLPGPRSDKIVARTEEGFEADQSALGPEAKSDAQLMPPPTALPVKRFTIEELRRVDLSICMNRVHEQGEEEEEEKAGEKEEDLRSADADDAVTTTVVTTITSRVVPSARSSSTPIHAPSPVRCALDDSHLPPLPADELRLSSGYVPYSPLRAPVEASPYSSQPRSQSFRSPQPSPLRTPLPSPFRTPQPSPRRTTFASPLHSRAPTESSTDPVSLVDQLPTLTPPPSATNTPVRLTPNGGCGTSTAGPSSQDYEDILLAHINAQWASHGSK